MALDEIIETFEFLETGEERIRYIIELGKDLEGLPEDAHTEENRVHGCMSRVWMTGSMKDGRLGLLADSDAFIVKGLIAILLAIYADKTPAQALETDPKKTFEAIGLESHLSMGRRNGLHSMVGRIRKLAATHG